VRAGCPRNLLRGRSQTDGIGEGQAGMVLKLFNRGETLVFSERNIFILFGKLAERGS